MTSYPGTFERLTARLPARVQELLRFGAVGGLAFVVDVGLFNVLRLTLLGDQPIGAKVVSVAAATLVAWVGNRLWTFSDRRRESAPGELFAFVVVNAIGLGIASACLAISHYVLGFTSPLADNISANGVGLVLGMVFRYLAYRHVVFNRAPEPAAVPAPALALTQPADERTLSVQHPSRG